MRTIKYNNYNIIFNNGYAEFTRYGVIIKCPEVGFTLDWVAKKDYWLSVLKT